MRAVPAWVDKVQDRDQVEQCIYDLCFNPDGSQLIVAAGQRVLVYDTTNGSLIQPLKGHKDTVYCVAYARDGKRFASGSADKNVIIWTHKLEGVLKYSHSDAIQCLAYNPVSHHLASCAISDFAFWSPEQKAVQKHKTNSRVNACAWTNDGQYLALGLNSGYVSIRNKAGEEKNRIEGPSGTLAPIWAIAWSPSKEENYDVICVADWGQKLSFYTMGGKQVGKERVLGYDPLCVNYFNKGEYLLISGTNRVCTLMTREGIKLGYIGDEQKSWVWCCAVRPDSSCVVIGCQDGTIAYYQLALATVHGMYKERYAYRENMTDVIIQHLLTEQKVRIKCRDLIKKIAVYKTRLAVQLPERVVIYELYSGETDGMHYRVKEKINQNLECNLLVVCNNHLVLCLDKRLQCIRFDGSLEREWLLDSPIRYIKVIGGQDNREGLLLGLKNGQVCKIFLDNPFPIMLVKIASVIRCLDMSVSKKKLAVVDENNQCLVYEIATKELLFQEPHANSVAWNAHYEDMLCFSGNDLLSIKASNFPTHQQKLTGFVVGFCGAKVFCLNSSVMAAVEVPLSTPMYQYLDTKQFQSAYKVACMGVTEADWDALAHSALEELEFPVAKLAFMHKKDLKYLELINDFQRRSRAGEKDRDVFLADILAYQCKFQKAAQLYKRTRQEQKALNMYTDLRKFELAQEYFGSSGGSADQKALIRKKAEWASDINQPRAAAEMFFSAGDVQKALEIIGEHGWTDMLIDIGQRLDMADEESMGEIAKHLRRLGQLTHAAEIYQKLGDNKSVMMVYVEGQDWNEAFALAEKHPELKDLVYVPYAQWLAEHDRFSEAQTAFHKAGRPEEAFRVLHHLTLNAVNESRFQDAGYYYWVLAQQCLEIANQDADQKEAMIAKYYENDKLASIYFAYDPIQRYIDEPFTSCMPESLFSIARFLVHETKDLEPVGVSQFAVLYTLANQARTLGAYKLAHQLLQKLQKLRVPQRLQDNVDLAYMTIKAKPYSDNEDLLPMCYRCSTFNQLMSKSGNSCTNCRQPFLHSFVSFEITPLVEFKLDPDITLSEALRLIEAPPPQQDDRKSWNQSLSDNFQTLQLDETASSIDDLFTARLMDFENLTDEFVPVTVDRTILKAMDPASVLICRWPQPLQWQFYRNVLPDLQITLCESCNKIFYLEDFEMQVLQKGYCPFCRCNPMDVGKEENGLLADAVEIVPT